MTRIRHNPYSWKIVVVEYVIPTLQSTLLEFLLAPGPCSRIPLAIRFSSCKKTSENF
jgi:hypothetical protein